MEPANGASQGDWSQFYRDYPNCTSLIDELRHEEGFKHLSQELQAVAKRILEIADKVFRETKQGQAEKIRGLNQKIKEIKQTHHGKVTQLQGVLKESTQSTATINQQLDDVSKILEITQQALNSTQQALESSQTELTITREELILHQAEITQLKMNLEKTEKKLLDIRNKFTDGMRRIDVRLKEFQQAYEKKNQPTKLAALVNSSLEWFSSFVNWENEYPQTRFQALCREFKLPSLNNNSRVKHIYGICPQNRILREELRSTLSCTFLHAKDGYSLDVLRSQETLSKRDNLEDIYEAFRSGLRTREVLFYQSNSGNLSIHAFLRLKNVNKVYVLVKLQNSPHTFNYTSHTCLIRVKGEKQVDGYFHRLYQTDLRTCDTDKEEKYEESQISISRQKWQENETFMYNIADFTNKKKIEDCFLHLALHHKIELVGFVLDSQLPEHYFCWQNYSPHQRYYYLCHFLNERSELKFLPKNTASFGAAFCRLFPQFSFVSLGKDNIQNGRTFKLTNEVNQPNQNALYQLKQPLAVGDLRFGFCTQDVINEIRQSLKVGLLDLKGPWEVRDDCMVSGNPLDFPEATQAESIVHLNFTNLRRIFLLVNVEEGQKEAKIHVSLERLSNYLLAIAYNEVAQEQILISSLSSEDAGGLRIYDIANIVSYPTNCFNIKLKVPPGIQIIAFITQKA